MPLPTFSNLQGTTALPQNPVQSQLPPGLQVKSAVPQRPRVGTFEEYRKRYGTTTGSGGASGTFGAARDPKRVTVERPRRADFGRPSREGIAGSRERLERTRAEYDDPTSSGAFQNLMSLATERTTAFEESQQREAQEIASRRGYVGGTSDVAERAATDKARALASAGFEGAAQIREQAAAIYGADVDAYTSLLVAHQQANTAGNLAYANALADAAKLQGELDSRFQQGRLDERQYEIESARLAEQARQFDTTTGQLDRAAKRGVVESDRNYFLDLARLGQTQPNVRQGRPVSSGATSAFPGVSGTPGPGAAPPAGQFATPSIFAGR